MFYKEINNHDNDHKFDSEHVTDKRNDKKFDITIINKVKLGDCYNIEDNNPFYISFDINTLNFHIVPKNRENEEYMTKIRDSLNKISNTNWRFSIKKGYKGKGVSPAYGHKWIEIVINHISFLLDFQTLSFDGDTLNCYLDEIQFVAYPESETLNYFSLNGDLHIMYPKTGKSNFCVGNNRVVYNPKFDLENTFDKPENYYNEVATKFIDFINKIRDKSNKIYEFSVKDSSPKVYSPNN